MLTGGTPVPPQIGLHLAATKVGVRFSPVPFSMKPPRRPLTVRALVVVLLCSPSISAGSFGSSAKPRAPTLNRVLLDNGWVQVDPLPELIAPVVFFGPFAILFALIYFYVPPKLGEMLIAILIIIMVFAMIVPALQHS